MTSTFSPTSPRSASTQFPPYSPYSNFHLPSSSSSESGVDDGDDADALPFPTALSRKDFLAPDFDPTAYLSSLFPSADGTTSAQRHQTLEDLRTELRERSSAISTELLELVNSNYTSFLSLGDELKGGDEKVEDVRVALFGFRRSIEDVQNRVKERRTAVSNGCRELGEVRSSISQGRRLLELDERVSLIEDRLSIAKGSASSKPSGGAPASGIAAEIWDLDDTDDEEEEDEALGDAPGPYVGTSTTKLTQLASDLALANQLADAVGHHIPFVRKIDERVAKCRSTLLLDLNTAVKEVRRAGNNPHAQSRLLKLLAVYRVLDSEDEAIKVLKEKSA